MTFALLKNDSEESEKTKKTVIEMIVFRKYLRELFEEEEPWVGSEVYIAKGVSLKLGDRKQLRAHRPADRAGGKVPPPEILEFALVFAKDVVLPVALGIVSNWLYDKIKNGKALRIRVNGVEAQANKENIRELLAKETKRKPALKRASKIKKRSG